MTSRTKQRVASREDNLNALRPFIRGAGSGVARERRPPDPAYLDEAECRVLMALYDLDLSSAGPMFMFPDIEAIPF